MRNGQWCPLVRILDVIGDRWSLQILKELASGPLRFKALKNNISGISMDQLTRKLDDLCLNHLIVRQEFSESPPRVEYQLTEKGRSLTPILRRLLVWGTENLWGQPTVNENVEIAVSIKTMVHFFGMGAGSVLFKMSSTELFFVERFEEGRVLILTSEDNLPSRLSPDATIEISVAEWIRLTSQKNFSKCLRVRGQFSGKENILIKLFPFLTQAIWLGGVHFSKESVGPQELWPNATRIQTAAPTKIR